SEEHTSELQSRRDLVCRLLLETKERRGSEEHMSELQSRRDLVCRLLLEKKKDRGGQHRINTRVRWGTPLPRDATEGDDQFFFLMKPQPPKFTLLPYTKLFI